jgi:hypothetical protein
MTYSVSTTRLHGLLVVSIHAVSISEAFLRVQDLSDVSHDLLYVYL